MVTFIRLFVALSCLALTDAFIAIADDEERQFPSKPDYKLGNRLAKGYKYPAHLQYLEQDMRLCGSGPWNITRPKDNTPIVLVVKNGGCSIEQKAVAASTLIYPRGIVRYIIVDGDESTKNSFTSTLWADAPDADESPLRIPSILPEDGYQDWDIGTNTDDQNEITDDAREQVRVNSDDISTDDEAGINSYEELQQQPENDDESFVAPVPSTSRVLRRRSKKKGNENIHVTILHVSYTVGYKLLDILFQESIGVREMGGTLVYVDGREPPASTRTILLWILLSASISAGACCCLLLCLSRGLWDDPPPAAPQRPVRRRLTHMQVRSNFPYYFYAGPPENEEGHLHECSICLDEFAIGARMRQLPCQHEFHATCVARWLIERSATCPLCKMDLYEEEEEDSGSNDDNEVATPRPSTSQWITGFLLGRSGNIIVPVDGPAPNTEVTNAGATVPTTAVTNTAAPSRGWWPWGRSSAPQPITVNTQGAPTTTAHWWPFSSWINDTGSVIGDAESTNGANRQRWFWQRRGSSQALTELTEPLLVSSGGGAAGDDSELAPLAAEEQQPTEPAQAAEEPPTESQTNEATTEETAAV